MPVCQCGPHDFGRSKRRASRPSPSPLYCFTPPYVGRSREHPTSARKLAGRGIILASRRRQARALSLSALIILIPEVELCCPPVNTTAPPSGGRRNVKREQHLQAVPILIPSVLLSRLLQP